ncbi:hypothetical protein ACFQL7_27775 [Halocatena marina]|uniref:Uncharacterized protein n=1 Tax=Halocatena marina TaxID=2934937 RepID=A0ABD5YY05_9EURY
MKITLHDETIHWQPDLREVDAWERQPGTNTVSGYGEDGHPLPTHDYRSKKAIY